MGSIISPDRSLPPADAASVSRPRLMPAWIVAVGGGTMELLSRSERMTNAKLKAASAWTPRWPSARKGLRAAVRALGNEDPGPRALGVEGVRR